MLGACIMWCRNINEDLTLYTMPGVRCILQKTSPVCIRIQGLSSMPAGALSSQIAQHDCIFQEAGRERIL